MGVRRSLLPLFPMKIAESENQNNGYFLSSQDGLSPGPAVGTVHALTPSYSSTVDSGVNKQLYQKGLRKKLSFSFLKV